MVVEIVPPATAFLARLSEPERLALLAIGRPGRWEGGEVLVRRGEPADSAIVLEVGAVKIHTSAADGTDVVLAFSGPGDLLGEIVAVGHAVRSATATAMETVEGNVIPVASLRAFLTEHPGATLAVLDVALARLYGADARRIEFAISESLARVAARLVELADRFGSSRDDGAIDITLGITQEELASWSASSRESTARALRLFRRLQLIETSRRRLRVLSLDGLRAHAPRL